MTNNLLSHFTRTLTGKGWLFVTALIFYIGIASFYLFSQKAELILEFEKYNNLSRAESALVNAGLAISDAYSDLFFIVEELHRDDILEKVHSHFQSLQSRYQALESIYPDQATDFRTIIKLLADTVNQPTAERLMLLRQGLAANKNRINELVEANKLLRGQTVDQLIQRSNDLALNALYLGIMGIIGAGIIISIFFTRMAIDLRLLRKQLKNMVNHEDDVALVVSRHDELGDIMRFTQQVAVQLDQRNGELTVERQKRLHQERRSAIDHLLAGLMHELGNPIAAISTITQNALYTEESESSKMQWQQVLDYIERMTTVLSDLNRLGMQQSEKASVVDINEEINSTIKVFKYDERWQEIQPKIHLDTNLAPIPVNGAAMQQILAILISYSVNSALFHEKPTFVIRSKQTSSGPKIIMENNGPSLSLDLSNQSMSKISWNTLSEVDIDLVAAHFLANNIGCKLTLNVTPIRNMLILTLPMTQDDTRDHHPQGSLI